MAAAGAAAIVASHFILESVEIVWMMAGWPVELQDALEVREQHLDLLPLAV